MPVCSILVTTHGTAPNLLRRAIGSILNQSLRDIEVIVVVDEAAPDIVDSLKALQDDRVKVIWKGRLGRGRALNVALCAATGGYVAIQDADDESHIDRLAIEHDVLERNPHFFGIGAVPLILVGDGTFTFPDLAAHIEVTDITNHLLLRNQLAHTSLMCRRRELLAVGGYSETRRSQYDYEMYLRARENGLRFGRCEVPLVGKRFHRGQFFETGQGARRILDSWLLQMRYLVRERSLRYTPWMVYATVRSAGRILKYHWRTVRSASDTTQGEGSV